MIDAPPLDSFRLIADSWRDLRGHDLGKRALEVAIAGSHRALLVGAPDSGADQLRAIAEPLGIGDVPRIDVIQPCRCPAAGVTCRCSGQDVTDAHERVRQHPAVIKIEITPGDLRYPGESARSVRARVLEARTRQLARGTLNVHLPHEILITAGVQPLAASLLERAVRVGGFDADHQVDVLRVARTIADLSSAEQTCAVHVAEAVQYCILRIR